MHVVVRLTVLLCTASVLLLGGAVAAAVVELDLGESKDPIFTIAGMKPGDEVSRTVTLANHGSEDGTLAMEQRGLKEAAGPAGGRLSKALLLRIERVDTHAVVYDGPVAGTGAHDLGPLRKGESRRYRFTVSLPDGGKPPTETTGDNAYELASLRVSYAWTLSQGRVEVLNQEREGGPGGNAGAADEPEAVASAGAPDLPFTGSAPEALLAAGLLALCAGLFLGRHRTARAP